MSTDDNPVRRKVGEMLLHPYSAPRKPGSLLGCTSRCSITKPEHIKTDLARAVVPVRPLKGAPKPGPHARAPRVVPSWLRVSNRKKATPQRPPKTHGFDTDTESYSDSDTDSDSDNNSSALGSESDSENNSDSDDSVNSDCTSTSTGDDSCGSHSSNGYSSSDNEDGSSHDGSSDADSENDSGRRGGAGGLYGHSSTKRARVGCHVDDVDRIGPRAHVSYKALAPTVGKAGEEAGIKPNAGFRTSNSGRGYGGGGVAPSVPKSRGQSSAGCPLTKHPLGISLTLAGPRLVSLSRRATVPGNVWPGTPPWVTCKARAAALGKRAVPIRAMRASGMVVQTNLEDVTREVPRLHAFGVVMAAAPASAADVNVRLLGSANPVLATTPLAARKAAFEHFMALLELVPVAMEWAGWGAQHRIIMNRVCGSIAAGVFMDYLGEARSWLAAKFGITPGRFMTVVNSARQVGKTTVASAIMLCFALAFGDVKLAVASQNKEQSVTNLDVVKRILGKLQDLLGVRFPCIRNKCSFLQFANGSSLKALSKNSNGERGGTYFLSWIDEAAFVLKEMMTQTLLPVLSVPGRVMFMTSTPQPDDPENAFTKLLQSDKDRAGLVDVANLALICDKCIGTTKGNTCPHNAYLKQAKTLSERDQVLSNIVRLLEDDARADAELAGVSGSAGSPVFEHAHVRAAMAAYALQPRWGSGVTLKQAFLCIDPGFGGSSETCMIAGYGINRLQEGAEPISLVRLCVCGGSGNGRRGGGAQKSGMGQCGNKANRGGLVSVRIHTKPNRTKPTHGHYSQLQCSLALGANVRTSFAVHVQLLHLGVGAPRKLQRGVKAPGSPGNRRNTVSGVGASGSSSHFKQKRPGQNVDGFNGVGALKFHNLLTAGGGNGSRCCCPWCNTRRPVLKHKMFYVRNVHVVCQTGDHVFYPRQAVCGLEPLRGL